MEEDDYVMYVELTFQVTVYQIHAQSSLLSSVIVEGDRKSNLSYFFFLLEQVKEITGQTIPYV